MIVYSIIAQFFLFFFFLYLSLGDGGRNDPNIVCTYKQKNKK
jgi:hypothetical protein